ncbi:MAG TPA: hypothetical protein VGR21_11350 [Cryptosporangiaceae bacterium]|nr:hypothetical protein [Cryptosporangiaceae bacterium]
MNVRAGDKRANQFRRLACAAALGGAALLPLANPAFGGPATVIHDRIDGAELSEANFCGTGLTVEHVIDGVQNVHLDGEGFRGSGRFRDVITNPDNGQSVVVSAAGHVEGRLVSGDPLGVHTHLVTFKGLAEKLQSARGEVLTRDAGVIAFADTFDGPMFLGSEVVINKGPHPEADADFALFCTTVVRALT